MVEIKNPLLIIPQKTPSIPLELGLSFAEPSVLSLIAVLVGSCHLNRMVVRWELRLDLVLAKSWYSMALAMTLSTLAKLW